jgi:hypothetical protein
MKSNNNPTDVENDERLLQYLTLVTAVLHQHPPRQNEVQPKHWWQYFLEPSVLTALVTILIGGIIGGYITSEYQRKQREKEAEQAWLKLRGDQALHSFKDYLVKEQELVKRAYSLIGNCISASDRLISQTGKAYSGTFLNQTAIDNQKVEIKRNFNSVTVTWQGEREEIALLMSYYHPKQQSVVSAWRKVQDSVNNFLIWAQTWNNNHQQPKPAPDEQEITSARQPLYNDLLSALAELSNALETDREYPWKGWQSLDELRSQIKSE